jgi:hypothetical protein
MRNWTLLGLKAVLILGIVAALGGCEPEPLVPQNDAGSPITGTPPTPTLALPTPTAVATEAPREFATYRHRSGVFAIGYPSDWEPVDESTDRHLQVRFDAPLGFGSRFTVDVSNEGQLSPDEVVERLQSFIQLNYANKPAYSQISQDTLSDGRIQAVFLYDDGRGGKGQETLTAQQVGPYFIALRIFLSDGDRPMLASTLSSVAASLMVDPQAAWGSQVAAINPAELLMINTLLWRDRSKVTHYTGEIYNASPSDASNIQIRATICDKNGIVLKEVAGDAALKVIAKGASIPFSFAVEGMPTDVKICSQQVSAEPAYADPSYTTSLTVDRTAKMGRQLVITGTVSNPSLAAVVNIHLTIGVYNKEGIVIGFATPDLGAGLRLEPGQSQPFDFTFINLGGQPDHYVAFVEAETVGVSDTSLKPKGTPTAETSEGMPSGVPTATSMPGETPIATNTAESSPTSTREP